MALPGIKIEGGITIESGVSMGTFPLLTTTSAQNYAADGPTMSTFRILNRGGNWNEFYASYTNGTWSCTEIPGSQVTNMYNPGDDSPVITITGGTFVLNSFYSFTGYA